MSDATCIHSNYVEDCLGCNQRERMHFWKICCSRAEEVQRLTAELASCREASVIKGEKALEYKAQRDQARAERDELQLRWNAICETAVPADGAEKRFFDYWQATVRERDTAIKAVQAAHESLKWSDEYEGKVLRERDALRARVASLEALIEKMRGQWIHSVHKDECLAALAAAAAPSGGGGE